MMDFDRDIAARVAFLRRVLSDSGAAGFVYGNSGGKDCTLAGILCKMASPHTLGVMMPCHAAINYGRDQEDALAVAAQYGIETRTVDLTPAYEAMVKAMEGEVALTDGAKANMPPRLRMTALYAIAAAENRLVVGTGNRSEIYMGYFTKWGDGGYDVNPIADLLVSEVYALLEHLGIPQSILTKAPSAGLYEGQTDEGEMGISYRVIDAYLSTGEAKPEDLAIIENYNQRSGHKRRMPLQFTRDILL